MPAAVAPMAGRPPGAGAKKAAADVPWSERHRPKHLGQVIGNTEQIRKLAGWLRDWDDVVLRGKKKEQTVPESEKWKKFPVMENINARAALISGPPGIGKTTTCSLVARCSPMYKLMEYNASDARGKTIIEQMSQSLSGNHTLRLAKGGESCIERAVIIMDECDGMSGGGDKGGMQALIKMIQQTKNPIICICNDRGDSEVRKLAEHCLDLRFKSPDNAGVAKRIKNILLGEGKKVEMSTIESIVEACGQDIRQVINQVQFFGLGGTHGRGSQKDTSGSLSTFDACTALLTRAELDKRPLEKRMDLVYVDADFVPLMVQENYMRSCETQRTASGEDELSRLAKAADLIATSNAMMGKGGWEVQNNALVMGTLYPSFLTASDQRFSKPAFPAYMKGLGTMNKGRRALQDMHGKLMGATTCGIRALVTSSYHDVLYRRMVKPLQVGAIKECAAALLSYGLGKEFFQEQAPALRDPLKLEDGYRKLEGKLKSALTHEIHDMDKNQQKIKETKRKREPGSDRKARSSQELADDGADEAEEGNGDGDPAAKRKKVSGKAKAKAKKAWSADTSKASLAGWKVAKQGTDAADGSVTDSQAPRKPILILRFIEGHTCAVRRQMHIGDVVGPWIGF